MKERPILFSAPMVRALLDGSKTQTRRPYKVRKHPDAGCEMAACELVRERQDVIDRICPYGQPGDRLWVRETWLYVGPGSGSDLPSYADERKDPANHLLEHCWYRATFNPIAANNYRWTPSIHMYRWASRINLEITGVRVERLQDISEADARAEGARECDPATGREVLLAGPSQRGSYVLHYRDIWEQINGAGTWDANPWVWVVEFRRID